VILCGCSDSSDAVTVTGAVTFRGAPLGEGDILFFPPTGHPIGAIVDAQGQYSIDLPPGEYRIIVGKSYSFPPGWKEGDPPPVAKNPLPAKYTEPTTTVLTATVTESQAEPINFALD
jgi:hypothetical protein